MFPFLHPKKINQKVVRLTVKAVDIETLRENLDSINDELDSWNFRGNEGNATCGQTFDQLTCGQSFNNQGETIFAFNIEYDLQPKIQLEFTMSKNSL